MSNKQEKIISRLLNIALTSELKQKHAAAICCGGKVIVSDVNTHRSKYGNELRCCGHAEIACINKLFPYAFRGKLRGQCVH